MPVPDRVDPRGPRVAATAMALAAAFLDGTFAFRLGCETYLLIHRSTPVKERALQ